MRESPEHHHRSTRERRAPGVEDGREHKAVVERSEAHRRWIGDDGDGVCRGFD